VAHRLICSIPSFYSSVHFVMEKDTGKEGSLNSEDEVIQIYLHLKISPKVDASDDNAKGKRKRSRSQSNAKEREYYIPISTADAEMSFNAIIERFFDENPKEQPVQSYEKTETHLMIDKDTVFDVEKTDGTHEYYVPTTMNPGDTKR
jgi:hypothetical protein